MISGNASAPRIGLVSPCGWGNLGDAAILDAVIGAIRERWPEAGVFALTLNPADTETRHGIPAGPLATYSRPSYPVAGQQQVHGYRSALRAAGSEWAARAGEAAVLEGCRLLVVAGGGQLDDYWGGAWGHPYVLQKWARHARSRGIPFAIVGTGFGTAGNALSRRFLRDTLRLASTCSVRDAGSLQLAQALGAGIPLTLCPDLAFGTTAPARELQDAAVPLKIGVSPMAFADPRVWPEQDAPLYRGYVSRLAETVRLCVRAGHEVHLFSTDGPDRSTVQELAALLADETRSGQVVANDTPSVGAVLALLARLDAVVASRLHGVILAMVTACPVVALSYERKVDQVMQDFGFEQFTHPIGTFQPAAIVGAVAHVLSIRPVVADALAKQIALYRLQLREEYGRVFGLVA